jgi:acyl-CoA dehydrogenase
MDFSLSEEQQEVRDLARKILEDRCSHERLKQVEASAQGVDLELWRELARANLLGVGCETPAAATSASSPPVCWSKRSAARWRRCRRSPAW